VSKTRHPLLRGFFGFLFTVFLFLTVAGYNAYRLTSFDTVKNFAVPLSQELGFLSFLDSFYPQIMQLAQQNPDASLELPIPVRLDIKGRDVVNLSQAEIKEYLITSVLRTVYLHPEDLKLSKTDREKLGLLAAVLDIFNQSTHELIRMSTLVLLALSLVFLFPFLYLSLGFSKLSGLGASLLMVSLPAYASLYAARISLERTLAENRVALDNIAGSLRPLIFEVQMSYTVLLAAGLLLLFSGWATNLLLRERK